MAIHLNTTSALPMVMAMANNLFEKLALVANGKILSTELAIELARRPEFVHIGLSHRIKETVMVNVLGSVVWDVSQNLLQIISEKFDEGVSRFAQGHPSTRKKAEKRKYEKHAKEVLCPECKMPVVGFYGLATHLRKAHKIKGDGSIMLYMQQHGLEKKGHNVVAIGEQSQQRASHNTKPQEHNVTCPVCKKPGVRRLKESNGYKSAAVYHSSSKEHPTGQTHSITKILNASGLTVKEFMAGKGFDLAKPTTPVHDEHENTVLSSSIPSDIVTNCSKCNAVGYRSIRLFKSHGRPNYHYGITHERGNTVSFHQLELIASKEKAEALAKKYHQTSIPGREAKQSLFFASPNT